MIWNRFKRMMNDRGELGRKPSWLRTRFTAAITTDAIIAKKMHFLSEGWVPLDTRFAAWAAGAWNGNCRRRCVIGQT